jgi:transposase
VALPAKIVAAGQRHVGGFERREQIRVFFLPSYSPELNPDELLVKTNALGPCPSRERTGNDGQRSLLPSDHAGEAHGGEELFS